MSCGRPCGTSRRSRTARHAHLVLIALRQAGQDDAMRINHQIVVFAAADLAAESTFWAGMLGGTVDTEDDWHMVMVDGKPRVVSSSRPTTPRPTGLTERRSSRSTWTSGSTTST